MGEKCTWIIDETVPQYVGHIGCTSDGSAPVGAVCEYGAAGATGFDNCANGAVCSAYTTPLTLGVCTRICDIQGANPMCSGSDACVASPPVFATRASSTPVAGVCAPTCDPLADNDFDGSGSALSRNGTTCGSAELGCYGRPSAGRAPITAFTCLRDLNYGESLVHRSECTTSSGCAEFGTIPVNGCNQGYEPLLTESTAVSTVICVALCKPLDCYAGNCGSGDASRLGAAPHRCMTPDAVGNFGSDEECQYLWAHELDGSGHWLRSAYSDTVGICVDHAAYGLPSCAQVPLHGSGSELDAVALGCVSSQTAGLP